MDTSTAEASIESKKEVETELTPWSSVWWPAIARTALMALGVTLVAAAGKWLTVFLGERSSWILDLALVASVVGLVFTTLLRHRQHWAVPADEMRRLIHEIRVGRAPIDEFTALAPGQLRGLAVEVRLLLHDLRQQRNAVGQLNDEVRRRIANRTTVLERTINALRNQTVRDPLTGLFNRRMLDQFLPQLISHCISEHKPLTLLIFDVYRFKELNDTLGRMAGDELLRSLGQLLSSTIREGDAAFRYGGDEFAAVLPGCEIASAKRVIERLQSLVQALGGTFKSAALRPKLSIGISTLDELEEPTAQNLLKRADQRLAESNAAKRRSLAATAVPRPAAPAAA